MKKQITKPYGNIDYSLIKPHLEIGRAPDATGYWFAGAVFLAFLTAGFIVYRAGDPAIRTASIGPITANAGQVEAAPVLPPR